MNRLGFIILIYIVISALPCFAQNTREVIDFEGHLSAEQVQKIEEQIAEIGLDIKVVFFNVNKILDFELKEPRSVDEYIENWEVNKNQILILFTNEGSDWENDLILQSTFSGINPEELDIIKRMVLPFFNLTKYNITEEKTKYQIIFFDGIQQIISQIANSALKVVRISNVGKESDKGFGAGIGSWNANYGKNDEAEIMEFEYSIDELKASYAKLTIFSNQGKLVYEKEIKVGKNIKDSWDGHKSPLGDKPEYITVDESPFKIIIIAGKKESNYSNYTGSSEYFVHEQTPYWLALYKLDNNHTIPINVELLASMNEKNRFRRFLSLEVAYYREYNKYGLDLYEKKITPLQYIANNFALNGSFYGKQLPFHQGFAKIISSIKFTGNYKSIWSLSMRYIRGTEGYTLKDNGKFPQISEHGTGTAFDLDPDANGMIDPEVYFQYMLKLTWLDKWGKIPSPQQLYDASNIFEKICQTRRQDRNIDVDKMMQQLSDAAFLIDDKGFKISEFINAFMNKDGSKELYSKYCDLIKNSIPLNIKRRQSVDLVKTEKEEEVRIQNESNKLLTEINNYSNIIDAYVTLFFLDTRELPIPINNQMYYYFRIDFMKVINHLNGMQESLHKLKMILAQQMDNIENKPIPEITMSLIVEKLEFTINSEFNERLVFFRNFDNHDFKGLGNHIKNNIGDLNSYVRKSFLFGFCNIEPQDANLWINMRELRWGAYKTRLDCMHFELNPNYGNEFYSIYNK